ATRGGAAVAYLAGAVDRGLVGGDRAQWAFAGHAAREPEALRDLFAHQAAAFGVSRFMVTVPATDPELIDVWFRLAFGCQAFWAVREVERETVEFAGTVRPATADDTEDIADLDELLYVHQVAAPSYSEFPVPPRDEALREVAELWGDGSYVPFVAELEGRVAGMLLLYRRPEGDLRVPAGNIDLAFA